ncbi:MAG: M20/M25/M40 family metallo-hydrolase, partial [Candidatus Promineifilaceae bacterium]
GSPPTLWIGLIIGLVFNAIAVWVTVDAGVVAPEHQRFASVSARTIGAPALMLFYASGLVLLMRRESWRQRLTPLAPVGRMALSNYLLQSVLAGLLFYGYGLGLYGQITPTVALIIVVIIYLVQIRLSEWWMERYRFGPAEWLWRTLAYGRWQPLRREQLTFIDHEPSRWSTLWRLASSFDRRMLLVGVWIALIAWASILYAWNGRLNRRTGEGVFTIFSQEVAGSPEAIPITPLPVRPVAVEPGIEALATPVVRPAEYQPSPVAAAGDVQAMTAALDVNRALDHIETLAGPEYGGRLAGSEGGQAAGEYIADRFADYGLQPASLDGTFFQSFPITYTILTGMPQIEVSYPDGSPAPDYTLYQHFSPLVIGYAGGGEASGPVHWVNQCRAEDFADLTLVGAIVFCKPELNNDALVTASRLALEYGAAGLLFLTDEEQRPADFASRSQELWVPETIPVLRVYPPLSEDLLVGSGMTTEELLSAEEPLVLKTTVIMSVQTSESTRVESRNVLGVLPGRDSEYADEVVVVGAHYDHMGLGPDGTLWAGANDNASGVSTVLEIARSWQALGFVPRRTVLFAAWDAEEWGLIGSQHYVEHPSYPLENTVGSFQLDMVGAGPGLLAINGNSDLAQQQLDVATSLDIEASVGNLGRSDHIPFLEAGVPATLLIWYSDAEPNIHYHRPADVPGVIEPERLEAVLQVADTVLLDVVESTPAIERLVGQRAAAAAGQDLTEFLSTSRSDQVTIDSRWFADLQAMEPTTVTMSLAEIEFQGALATADVAVDVTYGAESDQLLLTQPVHFSRGDSGWLWAGPALAWYPSPTQDVDATAGRVRVTVGYPTDVDTDPAPLVSFVADLYGQVAGKLGLPADGDFKLMLLPDQEAIRFSSGLSISAEEPTWIEPGLAQLAYTAEISRSQRLTEAIVQLVLANAGVTEQSAPWLWQGLPIAWRASQNLKQIHNEHLPQLSLAFAANELPPVVSGSWAATEYLIQKLGWEGFGRFIQDFGQACAKDPCDTAAGIDAAMIAALQIDLDAFNAAWLEHWRSHMNEVQANLDRLLQERAQALLARDRDSFLATVNDSDPYLLSSERDWFDRQATAPITSLTMAAQPTALLANGDVLADVTFEYQIVTQEGEPQQDQAVAEIRFTPTGNGYQWAGVTDQMLAGERVAIRYPDGQLTLARLLLSAAEDTYARLADLLQMPESQPVILELYPTRDSFRIAVGLNRPTAGWLPAWSAPGSNIKVQRQGNAPADSYHPALAYQLARQLLYQKGIQDEWLLKGVSSQLSMATGDRETGHALMTTLVGLLASETGYDQTDLLSIPADESLSNPAWLTETALAWDSVNYLLAREGWPAVLTLLDRTGKTGDVSIAFLEIFGQSAADFQGEWQASAANGYAEPGWLEAVASLEGESSMERIQFLGGEMLAGRQAGTPGAEIAANYIARRFAEYGLRPAGDLYPN